MHFSDDKTVSNELGAELTRTMAAYNMELLTVIICGIVHDFAGPLAAISGYTQLLQKSHPELDRELSVMASAVKRLEELLAELSKRSDLFAQDSPRITDINRLVSTELKFLEVDPIYKRNLRRQTYFESELPKVKLKPKCFMLGFSLIMQNVIGRVRSQEVSELELHTYHDQEKVWLKIEIKLNRPVQYNDALKSQIQLCIEDQSDILGVMLQTLLDIGLYIYRQMGFTVQYKTVKNSETILIGV